MGKIGVTGNEKKKLEGKWGEVLIPSDNQPKKLQEVWVKKKKHSSSI